MLSVCWINIVAALYNRSSNHLNPQEGNMLLSGRISQISKDRDYITIIVWDKRGVSLVRAYQKAWSERLFIKLMNSSTSKVQGIPVIFNYDGRAEMKVSQIDLHQQAFDVNVLAKTIIHYVASVLNLSYSIVKKMEEGKFEVCFQSNEETLFATISWRSNVFDQIVYLKKGKRTQPLDSEVVK